MANAVYDKAREHFLKGEIAIQTVNVKAVLVDTGAYTINLATHEFLSDITSGARIATSGNLTTKTTASGIFDADDITYTAVSGVSAELIVLYVDTGTAGTSMLIAAIDTATGLPVTPNGGNIVITWDSTGNKIFKL